MQGSLFLDTGEEIKLPKNLYKGSGGEGTTYILKDKCIKIYHDPTKCIPNGKIKELGKITRDEVIKPTGLVLSPDNTPVGIVAKAVQGDYLCRYFSQNYQQEQNVSREDIVSMVKTMQNVLQDIHKVDILVVDYNEMNFLIGTDLTPFHIDVDAYQTPSYKATAIMDSIRDPLVKQNKFSEGSDWFSFAVIACQLYTGAHPYKVRHTTLGKNWKTFMEKGISIFDSSVRLPPNTLPPSSIPKGHKVWMEGVFKHELRNAPPLPDALPPLQAPKQTVIIATETVEVTKVFNQKENITDAIEVKGVWYTTSKSKLYINGVEKLKFDTSKTVRLFQQRGEVYILTDTKVITLNGWETNLGGQPILCDSSVFILTNGTLLEVTIHKFGEKYSCSKKPVSTIFHTYVAGANIILQDTIGSCRALMPQISSVAKHIAELDQARILSAVGTSNTFITNYEKSGKFYVAVVQLHQETYTIFQEEMTLSETPMLVRMDKGIFVASVGDQLWLFKDISNIKKVEDSPVCPGSQLLTFGDKIYSIMNDEIYQIKLKK